MSYLEYLMTTLAEESAEVGQMACKVLRFYDLSEQRVLVPNDRTDGKKGNALELLSMELNDLFAMFEMLNELKILPNLDQEAIEKKKVKVREYWQKRKRAVYELDD